MQLRKKCFFLFNKDNIFFPKSPDQNLEMATLFSIVEKSNNYVFEDDLIPQNPLLRGYVRRSLHGIIFHG